MSGKPISMERKFLVVQFAFAEGSPTSPQVALMENFALASIHAEAGLANLTAYFQDTGEWGTQTVAEVPLVAGYNGLDENQVRDIAGCSKISILLSAPAPSASKLWLKLKS
jgi:hypothetical protein